jgi:hypothetical protein
LTSSQTIFLEEDISPTACRVMAQRLRDVCALPESEQLWRAGRGFVVRDLPSQRDNPTIARRFNAGDVCTWP